MFRSIASIARKTVALAAVLFFSLATPGFTATLTWPYTNTEMYIQDEVPASVFEALERDDFYDALKIVDDVIESEPDNPTAHLIRGIIFYHYSLMPCTASLREAHDEMDRTLVLKPDYIAALLYRERILLNQKLYSQAVDDANSVLAIDGYNEAAVFMRAEAYYELFETQAAITDLNWLIARNPNSAVFYTNRGLCYEDLNDVAAAIADYQIAYELYTASGDTEGANRMAMYIEDLEGTA